MTVFNSKATDTSDLYGTPESAFNLLLPYLPHDKTFWEPCAGYGAIRDYLLKSGRRVLASDISQGVDALVDQPPEWDICVTNPPWSRKSEFLERFYLTGKPFAMLLPCDLVNGKRTTLFAKYGLQLIVPSWRVRYLRFDGEKPVEAPSPNTGSAWFCSGLNLPKDLIFVTK
jgi:hypothetical protein